MHDIILIHPRREVWMLFTASESLRLVHIIEMSIAVDPGTGLTGRPAQVGLFEVVSQNYLAPNYQSPILTSLCHVYARSSIFVTLLNQEPSGKHSDMHRRPWSSTEV